ncbi:ribonuclease P protein component [Elusimicrobiota bacterium]
MKLKRINRLGKETTNVIKKGKRVRLDNLIMYYLPDEVHRISVVAGKKVGKSVRRNKLKRWVKEIFRNEKENLEKFAMVIILRVGAGDYKYNEILEKLNKLWKENKIKKQ